MKICVTSFAFASKIKDAGINFPTTSAAGNIVKGIIDANRAKFSMKSKHMADYKPLTQVYLLAGPNFFTVAGKGIQDIIKGFKN